ncbi:sensor histidine kinase [Streptomyces sp. NPDC091376]|uniref:sensor histidine kinase n=1 Tax=Streptomyces sp. NPDC091376 TaxID=3365994 RepID=UPI00380523BD
MASLIIELASFPPLENFGPTIALAAIYAAASISVALWAYFRRLEQNTMRVNQWLIWASVPLDLVFLTAILAISGGFSDESWNSPFVDDAFLLIPVLAAFQIRPRVTALVTICGTLAYILGIAVGQRHGNPYWHYTLTHALFIMVIGAGCVLLSAIQLRRYREIGTLIDHRSWLLARVMSVEERERNELAEAIHDGALQNVLAARHDIEEAAYELPSEALDRAAYALAEATLHLRSSVMALHAEILEASGLVTALKSLSDQVAKRTGLAIKFHSDISTAGSADRLLYRVAAELLNNIVKHANAHSVTISLTAIDASSVRLRIVDDGVGISTETLSERVAEGHIGIASHRIRVEGAGGTFTLQPNSPQGTVALVEVPTEPEGVRNRPPPPE